MSYGWNLPPGVSDRMIDDAYGSAEAWCPVCDAQMRDGECPTEGCERRAEYTDEDTEGVEDR